MKLLYESSQAIATDAARAAQHCDPASGAKASAAKVWIGESVPAVLQECVQLHGGLGVTWEYDLHLHLRRATTNRMTYGTPDEHRERLARLAGVEEAAP